MPSFQDSAVSDAPVEEVWKLLYDPTRFPDWWVGLETVVESERPGAITVFPEGYPDFPMAQLVDARPDDGRMVVSCQVSDLVFEWVLQPLEKQATRISVHVEIPEREAFRLEAQQDIITGSLRRLAALAGRGGAVSNG